MSVPACTTVCARGWTISFGRSVPLLRTLGINLLLFGAIGPFAAAVMDRIGARRMITLALATTAVSVVMTPAMSQPWQLVLLWVWSSGYPPGSSVGFWPHISPVVGSGHGKA